MSLRDTLPRSLLLSITAAYLAGQGGAALGWDATSPWWFGGGALLGLLVWLWKGLRVAVGVSALVLAALLANGALQRVLHPDLPATHLRRLSLPQQVVVEGWLYREPERFPRRARLYLEALQVWQDGAPRPATGKILLTVRSLSRPWRYGDRVRLPLHLRAPRNFSTPGSFDYEGYLARQGIYLSAFLWDDRHIEHRGEQGGLVRTQIEHTRRTIGTFFQDHLDRQTAAVLRAIIIGDTGGLERDLRDAFSRAGVAHVLAISGLHLGFVAVAAYGTWWWLLGRSRTVLLRWTMPKLAALLTIPPVLLYASLAGGSTATWRATIMALVYLIAILLDRHREVYHSLALAALVISLLWPGALLDLSFQLSFLAMLAILVGMERFPAWWEWVRTHWLRGPPARYERWLRWGTAYIAVSACAFVGTAPLTARHFHHVTVVGLLANLLVVPLLGSLAVILGLLAACLIFLHAGVAAVVVSGAGLVTQLGVWITTTIASWPYAALVVATPSLLELALCYGLLACLCSPGFSFRTGLTRYCFLALLVLLVLDGATWIWHRHFRSDLRVTFLDVGQGDAAVVQFPGSQVMVIDGGGFASEDFDSGEAILAPFLWSQKISRVHTLVMSHPQLDHYGGLAFLVERFAVQEFWWNGERATSPRFARLEALLQQQKVTMRQVCRETPTTTISGVQIQVLHPPCHSSRLDTNNASLVLRLSYDTIDVLFSGDIEAPAEQVLLSAPLPLRSEIVKVPHHGSRTSSTRAFVEAISPQVAVMSLGAHNRFRFPAPEVVQRYERQGSRVLRTDLAGTIFLRSDGQTYHITTMRNHRDDRPGHPLQAADR
ncbi:MAG: DNA internalization-related competence protein ComEC/Rec2 [Candidatus Binatia bacterium]|nr:DNA internalization-related competence protein ComEC/Rec2 [Candidatus Binatia bacterium]